MEIIDTWRLIKCLNHLLLVTLDLRPCISGVNSAFFFRNVLLSIEQKAIGASTLMETEVFVWIFFCMNTDAYHPNGPIWLDYRFCYRPLLSGT